MKNNVFVRDNWAVILAVGAVCLMAVFAVKDHPAYVDEVPHLETIERFCRGEFTIHCNHATIPGYHFILSVVLGRYGCSLENARLINFIISLLSIPVFMFLAFLVSPATYRLKTAQYALMPVLMPFFFMVYTDMLSVFLILLMFWSAARLKTVESAFWGTVMLLVRQNNILWVLAAFVLAGSGLFERDKSGCGINERLRFWAVKLSPFFMPVGFFCLFLAFNRGIAVDLKDYFPARISPLSIHVFLFFMVLLNLPVFICRIMRVKEWVASLPSLGKCLIALFSLAYLPVFLLSAVISHPWNMNSKFPFAVNSFLSVLCRYMPVKMLVYSCCLWAALTFAEEFFREKKSFLPVVVASSIVFLLPAPFVSVRYFLPCAVLINAFQCQSRKESGVLLLWYVALDLLFLPLFYHGGLFL